MWVITAVVVEKCVRNRVVMKAKYLEQVPLGTLKGLWCGEV